VVGIETGSVPADMMKFLILRERAVKTLIYPAMEHDESLRLTIDSHALAEITVMIALM
jgi:uncharacterized protein YciU (UPF0263 family)